MPSPYQRMQCSVGQYVRWVDSHSAREVLSAIQVHMASKHENAYVVIWVTFSSHECRVLQGCVEVYKNEVTNKRAKEFAIVYPFMIALLKQAAANKLMA